MPSPSDLAAAYTDAMCDTFPVFASSVGRHERDGDLGAVDVAEFDALARRLHGLRRDLEAHIAAADTTTRSDALALDGAIVARLLELEEEQAWVSNPDRAVETALNGCVELLSREYAPLEDRLRSLESRLSAFGAYFDGARRVWREAPAIWAQTAAESAAGGAEFFRGPLRDAVGASAQADRVMAAAATAADVLDDVAKHALEVARDDAPWKAGEDLVGRRLHHCHHLADTPASMEQRGLDLVEETLALLAETDPQWRATITAQKQDHPDAAGLVAAYRAEMERAQRFVAERGLAPATSAPLDVVPTPSFLAHVLPYAAYLPPGFFDANQTGVFWVTVPEASDAQDRLKGHFRAAITVTAVHEGYPGHHLQMTNANAAGNLLRVVSDSTLMIEGWAFYCEQLLWEQGYYDDGLRVAQLKDQLWRAARVVLDMRLHCGDTTFDEAVAYLVDVADLEPANAEAEVRRYTSTPTYQICYAIGKAEILALRDKVRAREGASFNLGRFHESLLALGSIPVPLAAQALLGAGEGQP